MTQPQEPTTPARQPGVVDNAIYVDGCRTANPANLDETYELLHERHA